MDINTISSRFPGNKIQEIEAIESGAGFTKKMIRHLGELKQLSLRHQYASAICKTITSDKAKDALSRLADQPDLYLETLNFLELEDFCLSKGIDTSPDPSVYEDRGILQIG